MFNAGIIATLRNGPKVTLLSAHVGTTEFESYDAGDGTHFEESYYTAIDVWTDGRITYPLPGLSFSTKGALHTTRWKEEGDNTQYFARWDLISGSVNTVRPPNFGQWVAMSTERPSVTFGYSYVWFWGDTDIWSAYGVVKLSIAKADLVPVAEAYFWNPHRDWSFFPPGPMVPPVTLSNREVPMGYYSVSGTSAHRAKIIVAGSGQLIHANPTNGSNVVIAEWLTPRITQLHPHLQIRVTHEAGIVPTLTSGMVLGEWGGNMATNREISWVNPNAAEGGRVLVEIRDTTTNIVRTSGRFWTPGYAP